MKAKRLCALCLALSMALTLCACWDEEKTDDFWNSGEAYSEEPTPEPEAAAQISAFTLPYLQGQSLNPVTCPDGVDQTLGALLYEGLFELDERFMPQNVLCSDYSYDAETYTYVFRLRSDVTFCDGSPLTAGDVLAAYRAASVSPRYAARFAGVASMRAESGALRVTLSQPNSAFPALLDIPVVKSGSEGALVPLGTGPYLYVTDSEGAYLLKNSGWWRADELPLERIELIPCKDNATASYLFSSYDAHLLVSDLTDESAALAVGNVGVTDAGSTAMLYLGFNTRRSLLSEAKLRRAMGGAFDREVLVTSLLAGHAQSARFPLSPLSALYPAALDDAPGDYAAALTAAGVSAERTHTITLLVNEEDPFKVSVAEYLCRALSGGGLSVTAKLASWEDYTAALQAGNFDLYLGEIRLTADWNVTQLIGTNGTLNYGGYADTLMDNLLGAFLSDENAASAQSFCRYFAQSAPILPLAFKSVSTLTPAGLIDGVRSTASNPFYGFAQWTFHLGNG